MRFKINLTKKVNLKPKYAQRNGTSSFCLMAAKGKTI